MQVQYGATLIYLSHLYISIILLSIRLIPVILALKDTLSFSRRVIPAWLHLFIYFNLALGTLSQAVVMARAEAGRLPLLILELFLIRTDILLD